MKSWLRIGSCILLTAACGRDSSSGSQSPTPAPTPTVDSAPSPPAAGLGGARPSPYEIDLRRRNERGDDEVLKLTEVGARYGIARAGRRVALRYDLGPAQLDEIHEVLGEQHFDRLQTEIVGSAPSSGTSLRVKAGAAQYSVSAMGRRAPVAADRTAYDEALGAVLAALPADSDPGPDAATLEIRWDPETEEHSAAIDLDVADALAGVVRRDGIAPNVDLVFTQPITLTARLRQGSPPKSDTIELDLHEHSRLRLSYDSATETVVATPTSARSPSATP